MNELTVTAEYGSYNARRYSRPWIGVITSWPVGDKLTMKWGNYTGDDSGGEVEIIAKVGEVVRHGQKDNRGNNSTARWYIVQEDGSLSECTAVEAKKQFRSMNP